VQHFSSATRRTFQPPFTPGFHSRVFIFTPKHQPKGHIMITLEANYSKKIGLPGYSLHQFSVTLKSELTDVLVRTVAGASGYKAGNVTRTS